MGAGAQKGGGAADLPAPPPPRSLTFGSEFAANVWTDGACGKKNLQIHKYADMCGRGLRKSPNEPCHRERKRKKNSANELTVI